MKKSGLLALLLLIAIIISYASNAHAVSNKMIYEGKITDSSGVLWPSSTMSLTFRIYSSQTATVPLWSETQSVSIKSGSIKVILGSVTPIPPSVLYGDKPALPMQISGFASEKRYLEVAAGTQVLGPRQKLAMASYAANADTLDGLDSSAFSLSTHTHSFSEISGTLAGSQIPAAIARQTYVDTGLAGKANTTHKHSGTDITSGTVAEPRIDALISRKADVDTQIANLTSMITALQNTVSAQSSAITSLQSDNATLKSNVSTLQSTVASQQTTITQLTGLLQGVTKSGDTLVFSGVNLQVVSGSGSTEATPNGKGNIIVGYNEQRTEGGAINTRTGSHNLIVGRGNNFSSFGGVLAGYHNEISAKYASVSGGSYNTASGMYSSITAGYSNAAKGNWSSISGGSANSAEEMDSSVSGGMNNKATGQESSVSGGQNNTASGKAAAVSGGRYNTANGYSAAVSGGEQNTASGSVASVTAGANNKASGDYSSVAGGGNNSDATQGNEAYGNYSTVLGGTQNLAGDAAKADHTKAKGSVVSAGHANTASGDFSTASGGQWNTASGFTSSVSGGFNHTAADTNSWAAGTYASPQ